MLICVCGTRPNKETQRTEGDRARPYIQQVITAIINAMFRLRHYPNAGDTFPQNYRPISLPPATSKIAERIFTHRSQEVIDDLNLVLAEQFGFRQQHATEHHILRLIEHVTEGLNRNRRIAFVFLEVSKALDRV